MKRVRMIALAAILPLGSCATVVEGTSQNVTINTVPQGAECHLVRGGKEIGAVARTPGSVRIDKSGKDITVTCTKEGYQTTTISNSSKFVGTTFGNILLGGLVGVVVDASSGANYIYPDSVQVALVPEGATPTAAVAPAVTPAVAQTPATAKPAEVVKTSAQPATPATAAEPAAPPTPAAASTPATTDTATPASTTAEPAKKKKIVMGPTVGH